MQPLNIYRIGIEAAHPAAAAVCVKGEADCGDAVFIASAHSVDKFGYAGDSEDADITVFAEFLP